VAIRRKALKDYTFTSGSPHIPAGSIACVSSYDLMHDPNDYHSPDTFSPFRFIDKKHGGSTSKFTDVSEKFPVWGYGSLAWYVCVQAFSRYF
jgi:cytochrome P450